MKRAQNRTAAARRRTDRKARVLEWLPVLARRAGFVPTETYVEPSDRAKGHVRRIEHPWNPAVRARMIGRSGVYCLRTAKTGRVEYVGENHTGFAWRTFRRHFTGLDSGLFAAMSEWVHPHPNALEVAFVPTIASRSLAVETMLRRELRPRYNPIAHDDEQGEDAPW